MKKLLFIITIFLLALLIVVITNDEINKLRKNEYSYKDIILIKTNTNKDTISYFFNNKLNNANELFHNKDYIKEKLKYYLELYTILENKDFNYIIGIINSYNYELIDNLISNIHFKKGNFEKYINIYKVNNKLSINEIIKLGNSENKGDPIMENIIKEPYYISSYDKRYQEYYNKFKEKTSKEIVASVNAGIDKDYYTNIVNTDMNKDKLILVNKYFKLDKDYVPKNLVNIDSKYGYAGKLDSETYSKYEEMYADALQLNLKLTMSSPYRSYELQERLYTNYSKKDGKEAADTYSARPGHSEHQTGLAFDLGSVDLSFEKTNEFKWLKDNAHKYGFIIRYPKGKEHLTGYTYEPWHFRYVGTDVASTIYTEDITFDEYYTYYIKNN